MAEIRVNATGGLKLFDADDSHYAQIIAGTITSNVDALTLGHASADFNIPVKVLGTTPTLTIGDAGAEDTKIVFDGNAQDFYIALDDSADDLLIGLGSTVGTTPIIAIDENKLSTFSGAITVGVDDTGHDVKLFGATSGSFALWDESADSLLLTDSTPIKIGDAQDLTLYHDGSNSYITNAVGALKVATETSGIAVTIGHTTSETTVADNLTVTGTTDMTGLLSVAAGINFPDSQAASADLNTLDDYEEGEATPTITFSSSTGSIAYNQRDCRYTKIGNFVACHFRLYPSSMASSSGDILITGLPFTQINETTSRGMSSAVYYDRIDTQDNGINVSVNANESQARINAPAGADDGATAERAYANFAGNFFLHCVLLMETDS